MMGQCAACWGFFPERATVGVNRLRERAYQHGPERRHLNLQLQCAMLHDSLATVGAARRHPAHVVVYERNPADAEFTLGPMIMHHMIDAEAAKSFSRLLSVAAGEERESAHRRLRILLDVSPLAALERIWRRNAPGESNLKRDYLSDLRDEHLDERWDVVIDADRPLDEVVDDVIRAVYSKQRELLTRCTHDFLRIRD